MSEPEASEEYFAIALEKRVMDIWMEFKKQQSCDTHTDVAWLLLKYWPNSRTFNSRKDKNGEFENGREDVAEISPETKRPDITTISTKMPDKSGAPYLDNSSKMIQVISGEKKASSDVEKMGKVVCKNAEVPIFPKKDLTFTEISTFDNSADDCVQNFEKSAPKNISNDKNIQITRKVFLNSESVGIDKDKIADLRPNFDNIVYEVRTKKRKGPKADAVCQTSDNVARETHGQIKVRIIHLSDETSVSKNINYIKALENNEKVEKNLKISKNENSSGQGVEIDRNSGKCANVEKPDSACLISDDKSDVNDIEIFKNSETSGTESAMESAEISNQTIQQTKKSDNDKPYPCAILVKTVSDSDPLRHPVTSDHNYVVPVSTARVDVNRGSLGSQKVKASMGTMPQPQNGSKGTRLQNESMVISTHLQKGSMVIQTHNENKSSGIQLQNRSKCIQPQKETKVTQPQNRSMVVQTHDEKETKVTQPQNRSMVVQTQMETKVTQPQNGTTQPSQAVLSPVPKETKEHQLEMEAMDIQKESESLVTQTQIGFKGTQKKIAPVTSQTQTGPKDPQTDTKCSKSQCVDASENFPDNSGNENLSAADNFITSPDQHYHLSEDADAMPYKERLKLLKNKGGSQTGKVGEKQKDLGGKKNGRGRRGPYSNTFKRTMKLIVRPNRPVSKESRGCGPDKFAAPNVPMSGKSDKRPKSAEFIAPDNDPVDSDSDAEENDRPSLSMSTEANHLLTQKVNPLPKSQGETAIKSVSSLTLSSPKLSSPKSSSKLMKLPTVEKRPQTSSDSSVIGNDLQVQVKEAASIRKESSTATKPGTNSPTATKPGTNSPTATKPGTNFLTATKPGTDFPTATKQLDTKETASINPDLEELFPIREDSIETMSPITDQAPIKKKPQKKSKGKKHRKQTSNKKEKLLPPEDDSENPNQPTKKTQGEKTKMSCDGSIVMQGTLDVQPLLGNFDKPFKCEFCWKSFIRQSTRDQHQKTHITEYRCPRFCDKSFPTLKDLNEHMKMNHKEQKRFRCSVCNMTFFSKSLLKIHQTRFPDNHSRCEQCSKIFSADEMLNHIREHNGEKLHQCEDCGKMFLTHLKLNCHFQGAHVPREKTPKQNLPCTLCKRTFATLKTLEHHQKFYNHDRQKFKCEVCDKEFPNSNQRMHHMRSHTGEKPFECDICHKRFPYNCLKGHKRIHTGEKPFQCDYCDKRFTIAGNKKLHMRNIHKEEMKLAKLLAEAGKNEANADTAMFENETMTSVMNLDLTEDSSMETDMQAAPKVVIQNNPMWEFTDSSSLHKNFE